MIKLVIINHTFQKPTFYKRWELLSDTHEDLDITLLAPGKWEWGKSKTQTYGHVDVLEGQLVEKPRFHIHLINTHDRIMGEYSSSDMLKEIKTIKPDITYFIGGHTAYPLMQIINLREMNSDLKKMKIFAFSMRGHTPTIDFKSSYSGPKKYFNTIAKHILLGPRLKKFNQKCDAVFCHYPIAFEAFRRDGFCGPVYIQTQVGVDPDIFGPDFYARERIREKYKIGDSYLFGSASRFQDSKGLDEIVKALPSEGNWKYLMMGWGRDDEVERIKNVIRECGVEDKVILTGYIDNWQDMAAHWNALDCAVHAPLTTPKWEETFSLALVQAMITGLPVIGSSSGSVPYQIGPDGIIIPEKSIEEMRKQMVYMMNNRDIGKKIGEKMRERAMNCFNIYHLNELFYLTIKDLLSDIYDENKIDMAEYYI